MPTPLVTRCSRIPHGDTFELEIYTYKKYTPGGWIKWRFTREELQGIQDTIQKTLDQCPEP